jgi:hypothetical protein
MITQEAIDRFKVIWKKQFDEEIDDTTAHEKAIVLLVLFDTIYQPIKKEWLEEMEEQESRQSKLLP